MGIADNTPTVWEETMTTRDVMSRLSLLSREFATAAALTAVETATPQ